MSEVEAYAVEVCGVVFDVCFEECVVGLSGEFVQAFVCEVFVWFSFFCGVFVEAVETPDPRSFEGSPSCKRTRAPLKCFQR